MEDKLAFVKWARDHKLDQHCLRRHRIFEYEPGHVRYQFGHYPCRTPYYPTEKDWRLLDLYAERGPGVVHVWWALMDFVNIFGKGAHRPINPDGIRCFIEECHRRRLKVVPYISPGFLDVRDPMYRAEWSSGTPHLREVYYDLDRMCPGSPGWRAYFFDVVERMLDDYGLDGLYFDTGFSVGCSNPHHDNHVHFVEYAPYLNQRDQTSLDHTSEGQLMEKERNAGCWDLWNEFLCEMYARVRRRGGLMVAHIGGDRESPFRDKSWDYLLLGEGVPDIAQSIEKVKNYEPYVLRFSDWSRLVTNWREKDFAPQFDKVPELEHLIMAASIPYLQFPWLEDGNYGEEEDVFSIPGVTWKKEYDVWTEWMKAQKKAGLPPIMGASFIAGRDRYLKYFEIYKKMTTGNTTAYLEVKTIEPLSFPVTEANRRVSVFVNESLWVALGNLGSAAQQVVVRPLTGQGGARELAITGKALTVLQYYDLISLPEVITFPETGSHAVIRHL